MKALSRLLILLSLFSILLISVNAQEQKPEQKKDEKPEPFSAPTFAGLRLRPIGPALTGAV